MSAAPPPLLVHRESAIVGMKIMHQALTNRIPPDDKCMEILQASVANHTVALKVFPLELLEPRLCEASKERRQMANHLLQVLLHRAGDPRMITREDADRLAESAWTLVASMEAQGRVADALSTLERRG